MRKMLMSMILVAACAGLTACQTTPAGPTSLGGAPNGSAMTDGSTTAVGGPGQSTLSKADRRGHGREEQIEGLVDSVNPPLTLVVAGVTVITNVDTKFYLRGGPATFASLAVGQRVHVKGATTALGFVAAAIMIQNTNDLGGIDFTAVIASKAGISPDLTLVIGAYTVKTNIGTTVKRKGDVQTPEALQVGMTVHVVGRLELDGTVTAKMIQIEADAVGGLFLMTGHIGGRNGTCPSISFKVSGYDISTSGVTIFVPNCASMTNGREVEVRGIVQANGTIAATRIERQ